MQFGTMDTVVIQWHVAEVAGNCEIVANPPRFLRRKKLLFRSSFVLLRRKNVSNSFAYWSDIHSKAVTVQASGHIFYAYTSPSRFLVENRTK